MHPFERELLRQVGRSRPALPGRVVVVGVSGGPDSSALLAAMSQTRDEHRLTLVAAHLDHGLRPDSERDRVAAGALAASLGVPFVHEATTVTATPHGSLEAGARAARYAFLLRVAAAHEADAVAVGHTRDDQVETILFRLLRGTGLTGLGGMRPVRRLGEGVALLRPLLTQTRAQVEDYVAARGLAPIEDSSNADPRFARNRLRHQVLPALRRENPQLDRALLRLARQARRADRNLGAQAAALLSCASREAGWSREALAQADPAARGAALAELVRRLSRREAGARHVQLLEQLLLRGEGATTLPGGARLGIDGATLSLLTAVSDTAVPDLELGRAALPLEVPGQTVDDQAGLTFVARLVNRPDSLETDPTSRVLVDAARLAGRRLAVRRRQAGDTFWPLGAPGHRSLKRFFIDQRVPREMRGHVPIVTVDDQPLWIVGHRLDEQFKVTPSTAEVLELRASKVVSGLKVSL